MLTGDKRLTLFDPTSPWAASLIKADKPEHPRRSRSTQGSRERTKLACSPAMLEAKEIAAAPGNGLIGL